MWGTRGSSRRTTHARRFIPTHVGNTAKKYASIINSTVHPHACGEHPNLYFWREQVIGSSPRMWGTLPRSVPSHGRARFIPTHVGNTIPQVTLITSVSVHPHACGEHWCQKLPLHFRSGSSPRMWGTPANHARRRSVLRFIPTHVGNTLLR